NDLAGDRSHSEQTAREIDEEIKHILDDAQSKVRHILQTRRPALEALAQRLIVMETIDNAELKEILEESYPTPKIVPGTSDAANPRVVPEPTPTKDAAEGAG